MFEADVGNSGIPYIHVEPWHEPIRLTNPVLLAQRPASVGFMFGACKRCRLNINASARSFPQLPMKTLAVR